MTPRSMTAENLFALPADRPAAEEQLDLLAQGNGLRIERIVSRGHTTAKGRWYDQEQAEWVVLLQGEASLEWDDGSRTALAAGDWLLIPAHKRHRVTSTTAEPPCIWLAVHGEMQAAV